MEENISVTDIWRMLDDFPVMEMINPLGEGSFCLDYLANQCSESGVDVALETGEVPE